MAVYLIERLSSSIPDWLRQALDNNKQGFGNSWKTKDRVGHYPLDKMLFKNKGIPSTRKEIERDFLDGNTPVIQLQMPNKEPVVYIIEPDKYSKATSDTGRFNSAWKDSFDFWNNDWKEIKPYVLEYGVIYKGDKERDKLKTKRQDRRSMANTLKHLRDPEYYVKDYQAGLKRDANLNKLFKKLDVEYDNLTDLFDKGISLLSSVSEDDANGLYRTMEICKRQYLSLVSRLENELQTKATSYDSNNWTESGYKTRSFIRDLESLIQDEKDLTIRIEELGGEHDAEEI